MKPESLGQLVRAELQGQPGQREYLETLVQLDLQELRAQLVLQARLVQRELLAVPVPAERLVLRGQQVQPGSPGRQAVVG